MKTAALTLVLLVSGAAFAQAPDSTASSSDTISTVATPSSTAETSSATMGPTVQPSNASPERDARGIAVLSDPATVPAGFNGLPGGAMGGPLVDPVTGKTLDEAAAHYPACSKKVTDNCRQTYGRRRTSKA